LKFAALLLAAAAILHADGGSVLLRQQDGPFLITVFGTPQVGRTDFSVLVQNAANLSPVLDADVDIFVAHNMSRATHQQATNKLLYAATIQFFRPGSYSMLVRASRNGEVGSIDGNITVATATPPWISFWPYFALVPAAVLLFALNQWLKSNRLKRRPAPP
jgi:hypothetical protein